jgi:hypothetical protein
VLNGVEVWRVGWPDNRPNLVALEPVARCARLMDRRVIVHKKLRRSLVKLKTLLNYLNVTLGGVTTAGSIRITVHNNQRAPSGLTTFIEPNSTLNHLSWLTTS